jgi:hypothetical protein
MMPFSFRYPVGTRRFSALNSTTPTVVVAPSCPAARPFPRSGDGAVHDPSGLLVCPCLRLDAISVPFHFLTNISTSPTPPTIHLNAMLHFCLLLIDEKRWKEWRLGRSTHLWLILPLTLNGGSRGVVLACAWCIRTRTSVHMILMRESWRNVVGSTVLRCVSPLMISEIFLTPPLAIVIAVHSVQVSHVDLHRITTAFDRIDSQTEEGVALRRTRNRIGSRRQTTIGNPVHFE